MNHLFGGCVTADTTSVVGTDATDTFIIEFNFGTTYQITSVELFGDTVIHGATGSKLVQARELKIMRH